MNGETQKRIAPAAVSDAAYTIDLKALLSRLLDKWWIIALSAIVCAVVFAVYSFMFASPSYEATAKLYVVSSKDSVINVSDFQISNYLAEDYVEVFKNWHVHERVLDKLGLDYTYTQLNSMIEVSNPSGTRILCIKATSGSAEEAQLLANTYAEVSKEFISVTMETTEPTTFEEALLPTSPSSPNKTKNTMVGFILGGLLACAVITVLFMLDDYVRTADDVEKYLGLPVLGVMMLQDEQPTESDEEEEKSHKKGGEKHE